MKYNAAADWKIGATIRQIPPLTTHLETLVDYAAGPVKVALKQQIITDLQHQFGIQGIAEQAALPETKTLELDTAKGGAGSQPGPARQHRTDSHRRPSAEVPPRRSTRPVCFRLERPHC